MGIEAKYDSLLHSTRISQLVGEFFIFDIGLSPRLGKQQYDEIYDDIARATTAAVAARPEAKKLLTQRTFVRAVH
jgi:hypothetical protein